MSDPAVPDGQTPQPEQRMPTSQPILLRALRWGAIATVVLVAGFAGIGYLVGGTPALIGGGMGAAFAGVFLVLTVGSIAFANRFIGSDLFVPMFFGIVLGTWIVKFIGFIVVLLLLRGQPWLDPLAFFIGLLSGVLVSLVIDVLVVAKSRMPVITDPSTD